MIGFFKELEKLGFRASTPLDEVMVDESMKELLSQFKELFDIVMGGIQENYLTCEECEGMIRKRYEGCLQSYTNSGGNQERIIIFIGNTNWLFYIPHAGDFLFKYGDFFWYSLPARYRKKVVKEFTTLLKIIGSQGLTECIQKLQDIIEKRKKIKEAIMGGTNKGIRSLLNPEEAESRISLPPGYWTFNSAVTDILFAPETEKHVTSMIKYWENIREKVNDIVKFYQEVEKVISDNTGEISN